jgi:GNAT superfamily N-acetyltransferase
VKITYRKERFVDLAPELPPLFKRHWEEIALNRDKIPLNPQWAAYGRLEQGGALHIVTARHQGELVGYFFCIVVPDLHYGILTCHDDLFYILPEYRKGWIGYRLFSSCEKMLRALGVQRVYCRTKVDHPVDKLLVRLGYRLIERVYAKLLE